MEGETDHCGEHLHALAEDLGLLPAPTQNLTTACNSVSGISALFGPPRVPECMWYTHHTRKQKTYTNLRR